MSNVLLFNLTTVLFGVASALYLGALYAKNEKLAVFGTWTCVVAAVVSTAALGWHFSSCSCFFCLSFTKTLTCFAF